MWKYVPTLNLLSTTSNITIACRSKRKQRPVLKRNGLEILTLTKSPQTQSLTTCYAHLVALAILRRHQSLLAQITAVFKLASTSTSHGRATTNDTATSDATASNATTILSRLRRDVQIMPLRILDSIFNDRGITRPLASSSERVKKIPCGFVVAWAQSVSLQCAAHAEVGARGVAAEVGLPAVVA